MSKTIDGSKLQYRDGIAYEANQEKPYTGKVIWWHENGQKEIEKTYKDGELNGEDICWHKDGELNGKSIWWYKDGQKSYETTFEDDIEI